MANEAIKPTAPVSATPPTEAAPQTEQQQTPTPDARLEQLAKQQRAIRMQQKQLQQEKAALAAEREKIKSAPPDTSWKERIKTNLADMLAEAGYSQQEAAQVIMNQTPESIETKRLNTRIAELEAKLNSGLDDVKNSQTKAYQQAIKQVERDVQLTTHNNEAFEIINSKGKLGQDAVVEYIKTTYEEDGILLSADEAAQEVEDYLLEEAINSAKLKKVQAKLAPQDAKNPEQKTSPLQKTPTLTNQATTSTPSGKLTAAQRRERAILAMQGMLTK